MTLSAISSMSCSMHKFPRTSLWLNTAVYEMYCLFTCELRMYSTPSGRGE